MKKTTKKIVLITSFTSVILLMIHFINKLIFYINTFKEHLYTGHNEYYNWRFGKIYYTKKGSGPAILLVHDLNHTSSHYEWKEVADKLAKSYTVYTLDLIGCGNSDKPKITYTNYLFVQLLSDFMRDVIKEKTTVVSTRYSCSISIMACYINSTLFDRLILINPREIRSINKYPKRKHKVIKFFLEIPIIGTLLYNIKNSRCQIRKTFYKEYLYEKKPVNRYIKAYSEAAHTSGSSSKCLYTSIKCYYTNTNIVHALKAITNPIMILEGSDNPNVQEILDEYETINPSIESTLLFNIRELPQIEKPDQIVNLISSYLN